MKRADTVEILLEWRHNVFLLSDDNTSSLGCGWQGLALFVNVYYWSWFYTRNGYWWKANHSSMEGAWIRQGAFRKYQEPRNATHGISEMTHCEGRVPLKKTKKVERDVVPFRHISKFVRWCLNNGSKMKCDHPAFHGWTVDKTDALIEVQRWNKNPCVSCMIHT